MTARGVRRLAVAVFVGAALAARLGQRDAWVVWGACLAMVAAFGVGGVALAVERAGGRR